MSKFAAAVLLIALGLGVGLWLGFNPKAHAATEENMARATASMTQIKSDIALKLEAAKPATETQSSESPAGASPLKQAPEAAKELWSAAQQLWVSLLARIEAAL